MRPASGACRFGSSVLDAGIYVQRNYVRIDLALDYTSFPVSIPSLCDGCQRGKVTTGYSENEDLNITVSLSLPV